MPIARTSSDRPLGLLSTTIISGSDVTLYRTPTGCKKIVVHCTGGGGAGGGSSTDAVAASAGAGGGAGAYSRTAIDRPEATYEVAVGAAGAAGAAEAAGGAGGDTTFGNPSVCTAKGGAGGAAGGAAATTPGFVEGAAGGANSSGVGDLKVGGGYGGNAARLSGTVAQSGRGGQGVGPHGGGPLPEKAAQGAGFPGRIYGAGGSGGVTLNGGATTAGGAGAAGVIVVEEYG